MLIIGISGMVISLFVLGLGFALSAGSGGGAIGDVTAISLIAYISFFAIGLGPVFWLLISEIFPLEVRGTAMSIATVANWGANFIITFTFLGLVDVLGKSGTFWLFAAIGIVALIFSWRLVPETRGLAWNRSRSISSRESILASSGPLTVKAKRKGDPSSYLRYLITSVHLLFSQ